MGALAYRPRLIGPTSPDWVAQFTAAQRRRGLRPATIRSRRLVLNALVRDLGDPMVLAQADIEGWLDGKDLCPRSRANYTSDICAFYEWAVRSEVLVVNPARRIDRPRLPRIVPRPISDTDLAEALDQAHPVMRAWLALAAYAGFRCIEIARLRREDVLDTREPPLLVVADGKGGHQRVLPLHPEVGSALRCLGPCRGGWMFPSRGLHPYSEHTVSVYGNRYLRDLGIEATMHQLRHWFGTQVYATSRDLRLTQELMGHRSPVTTSGYAAWATSEAADVVGRLAVKRPEPTLRLFGQ